MNEISFLQCMAERRTGREIAPRPSERPARSAALFPLMRFFMGAAICIGFSGLMHRVLPVIRIGLAGAEAQESA